MRETRRQPTMDTEYLASDNRRDRKAVECVNEGFPSLDVRSPLALIVESVHTSDIGAFMVSSQEEEILWKLELVAKEQ